MISVIIPVYNTSHYLERCFNSLLNQTYKNFEIIAVDDASTDSSAEIIEKYRKQFQNIKLFKNTENKGVSAARNIGLEKAAGNFVVFFDSDDWAEPKYLETFISNYIDECTIVIQDIKKEKNGFIRDSVLNFKNESLKLFVDFDHFINNPHILEGFLYNKFFEKKNIVKGNLRFDENITHLEDEIFCFNYYKTISTINCVAKSHYHYDISRENSLTKKKTKI